MGTLTSRRLLDGAQESAARPRWLIRLPIGP